MIRIVLDTNVLASAILVPQSKPAHVIKLVLDGASNLVISPDILEETFRVLRYPELFKLMKKNGIVLKEVIDFIEKMSKTAVITQGKLRVDAIKDDPSDNKILACAVEGEVDFIISEDHHITDLKEFQGIQIVSPATFLALNLAEEEWQELNSYARSVAGKTGIKTEDDVNRFVDKSLSDQPNA